MSIPALNPSQRATALHALETETFDILVIGGGVTGAGSALAAFDVIRRLGMPGRMGISL